MGGNVERVGGMIDAFKILIEKLEGKK